MATRAGPRPALAFARPAPPRARVARKLAAPAQTRARTAQAGALIGSLAGANAAAAVAAARCLGNVGGFVGVANGAVAYMMRHRNKKPKLSRPADQRKALLRSLTTELLRYGRIKTTMAKAKAMRKPVDHMITLAKRGTDWDMVQAMAFVYDKQLVKSLFEAVPDRYGEREGGYTRIYRTMPRKGDNAPMAVIELV